MGRVAYFGKAAKMNAYLAGINHAPTADTNPAEFILDLVNKDFTSTASVRAVLDKWSEGTGEAYGCDMEHEDGAPLALADFRASAVCQAARGSHRQERRGGEARALGVPRETHRQL